MRAGGANVLRGASGRSSAEVINNKSNLDNIKDRSCGSDGRASTLTLKELGSISRADLLVLTG